MESSRDVEALKELVFPLRICFWAGFKRQRGGNNRDIIR
jgi:hypothetical protein